MSDSRAAGSQDDRWDGRAVRQWLPEVVSDIVKTVDPVRIILFGSAARDEIGANSDLDLLVVLDELKPGERPVPNAGMMCERTRAS